MLDNEHLIPWCCAQSHGGEHGVIGQKESFTVGVMNLVVGDIHRELERETKGVAFVVVGDVGDINGLNVGNPGVGSQGSLLANRFLLLMTKNSENNVFVIGL